MPEFPIRGARSILSCESPSSSRGAAVVTPADTSPGAWAEVIASTKIDSHLAHVSLSPSVGLGLQTMVFDVAIGAAASEQIIMPDLFAQPRAPGMSTGPYQFPIFIPAGTRLSARAATSAAWGGENTHHLGVQLFNIPDAGHGSCDVVSYGSANVDPGGTADTYSSWVELASATERLHNAIFLHVWNGNNSANANQAWKLQIGVGSAASEQVIVPEIYLTGDSVSDQINMSVVNLPVVVPSGSRISIRAMSTETDANKRDFNIRMWGV